MKTTKFLALLFAVILLVCAFSVNALAAENQDIYVSTAGVDTNAGTQEAPVASLDKALELVANGGTIRIVDSYVAPADFVWENHNKDVTISGGTLDLSKAGDVKDIDGKNIPFYYQGDSVTFDNLRLVLADNAYYCANGNRLQVNANVTVSGANIQLYGGGANGNTVASTDVTLLGGSYLRIYGGGYKAAVSGDSNLYVGAINAGYKVSHDGTKRVHGGGYYANIGGDINLTVAGATADFIDGGSNSDCTISGDVNVRMSSGTLYCLYGGGYKNNIRGNINLTMNGGTVAQVFGANRNAGYEGNVSVTLAGGTITRRFFGGCYNNYEVLGGYTDSNHVVGKINVCIYEGMNFAWNSAEDDLGLYAHSRYNPLFDEEVSNIWFMGSAAQSKHEKNLGSQNSGMRMVMGSVSAADAIAVSDMTTNVAKWNIVLGDTLGANFYVSVPEIVAKNAVVNITIAGQTESYALSKQTPNAQGLYLVPVKVAAAQMTENITVQLVSGGQVCEGATFTVKEYVQTILAGDYSAEAKALAKHMLNYGAAAQKYFDINQNDLANAGYELTEEVVLPQVAPMTVTGAIENVYFYGASMVFDYQAALRFYFWGNAEGIDFGAYEAVAENDKFYVEVPGIDPQNYDKAITITATKGEESLSVSYSPLNYIDRMSQNGSEEMQALVKAMYGYHQAADAYSTNCGATVVLPAVSGGVINTEKNEYLPGQMITITVMPEEGYNLTELTVMNGDQVVELGEVTFAGGTFTFEAETGNYTVDAKFAEKIFQDAENWDLTGQYDGVVTIKEGYEKGRTLRTYESKYRDVAVTVKDFQEGTFKAELHFVFGEGREFQIRLHNENTNGEYRVQKMATSLSSGWKNLYTLNEAEVAALQSDGIRFRVVIAGTKALAYINGTQIGEVDLAEQITATELAQIKMVMYGNNGVENVQIPYALGGIFQNTVHYDLTNQNNGSVVLLEGYEKGRTLKTNESDYRDVALTVKHLAEDTFKAEVHFTFGEGKAFQIRLHNENTNGEYRVQKMATDLSTGWKNLYTLNASEVEALKSEGVEFRVVIADTYAIAFINDKQVGVVDLTGGITTEMAQIAMILYGNVGVQNIEIPFELGQGAEAATVQLAETTNGNIKTNKSVCVAGDTITITATPDEGYYLAELTVNGEAVAVSGGKYSFATQAGDNTVSAVFAQKIFQDTAYYDLSNQNNGSVILLEGYAKGRTLTTLASNYREIAATVKHLAEDTFKAEYHFTFGEGKAFQIRLHNENTNGEYRVQKMATDLSTGWKNLYTLNASEVEALKSEGVEFRVVIADTYAIAYINDKQVGVVDLTGGITTEMAQISMILYGNVGVQNMEVPFTLGQGAEAATVQLAETTNGNIKTNKSVCVAGDTITITATPDEGYYLSELLVNGEAVAVSGGKYSFAAQAGSNSVSAVFGEKIFQETEYYNLMQQGNGVVTLLEGYAKGRTLITAASSYREICATVKHLAADTFKAEYHFVFGEGKEFQIRLHNENTNGEYRVQKMATTLSSGWKNLYTLNASEVEALQSEGVEFRVVIAGTNAVAYINGVQVGVVDLSAGITTETAQIKVIMYGNVGVQNIAIPFALGEGPAISTVTAAETANGATSVNKNIFVEGQTVAITATPAEGYNLKSLVVKCDGQVVQTIVTKATGGAYSYVIPAQGAYTVEAEYAAPLFRFQNDTDKKNWNVDDQYNGLLTILGKTKASGGYARIITAESTYKEASVTVSDLAPTFGADGKGNFQMQIRFKFANGKEYHVRLHNTDADGKYKVQSMKNNDNCITGWKWLKDLSTAQTEAMLDGSGVNFRAALEGSNAVIYLDGTKIATVDLSAGEVTADSTAEITFIMYGNDGVEPIELPFTLG
ncbi:MAG: hypothetical protein IKW10_05010 [Oscillospiraceae bacterium]|nr:hypothetical protein [Oscillospiraceae bacterium]